MCLSAQQIWAVINKNLKVIESYYMLKMALEETDD